MKEESIEITEFPKYFKRIHSSQCCRLTEQGIFIASGSLLWFQEYNESTMFTESVFDLFDTFLHEESNELEFTHQYHLTIKHLQDSYK